MNEMFNDSTSSISIIEQAPIDQQPLDVRLLDAITETTTSTAVYVLDKSRLTLVVEASGSADITVEVMTGQNTDNMAVCGLTDNTGTTAASQSISTDGTHVYGIDIASKYVSVKVTRTAGTATVYITGGAL